MHKDEYRMKTLLLVRHAKSSWKHPELSDIDRPLNKRGKQDAKAMTDRLRERNISVEVIISSTAVRALRTAELLAEGLKFHGLNLTDDRLYAAAADQILDVIEEIDPQFDGVMIIGHNPGMTELACLLTRELIAHVPTCGVVHLLYSAPSWQGIRRYRPEKWELIIP
ncbi:MAG: histidine phosphatase family protein [Calditrichaeota bacterium]|nr:MAG: histidine phosphatase family protein [Calditrichota bacterium]